MSDTQRPQGPASGVLNSLSKIGAIMIGMVETRLNLIAVELEEEKTTLIQLILMAGITLLLTAFGLMSLLILIFWVIPPEYRVYALAITTATLLLCALIGAIMTLRKARNSTLLGDTRQQLELDKRLLEQYHDEQTK
ncbi:phage holin family protein [Proteus faecis]|uniref:Phage holin family protein n=1 Tax=Proteus faecis TaxID=2050967 RepID=A0AAW7CTZ0_9GAMM|nr:phage holin family protein [Proteus faecis]MBG3014026.1 phage holin family protein [Proteus mirabilis]MDO5404175.1 phage holin family protein [Proteus sp. (in: enterobacteria)]QNH66247.1 phage holin family protein [Proteus vulgaris]MCT8250638.1 phage holin family protein [Proteus faecis]MDL5168265.1 phage holin family protein [Proteus faecis]